MKSHNERRQAREERILSRIGRKDRERLEEDRKNAEFDAEHQAWLDYMTRMLREWPEEVRKAMSTSCPKKWN